ncbi:MAG TPA: alanyl-tRNA editing protein, partial [Bacillota bacterium]|nr:alanyl-tRNA editing protein [Bacillota bacterium]
MPTKRLYYDDPYLAGFTCQVLRSEPAARNSHSAPLYEVITDLTAFYPNSGGQPSDRGTLAGADVVDVIERDDEVIHITSTAVPLGPAQGRIDIERRFDH